MKNSAILERCTLLFKTYIKIFVFFLAKLLLTDQDRFSRNANHHDHNHHHHDHDHDPESILGKKIYNNKKMIFA